MAGGSRATQARRTELGGDKQTNPKSRHSPFRIPDSITSVFRHLACYMTMNMSNRKLNGVTPYIQRILDLNDLLGKKSHFLFGPRQTGKKF